MKLRPDYQQPLYDRAREALKTRRSILVQLATGGGKTPVMAAMCESVYEKIRRAWIVPPRIELVNQASNHLLKWGVPHHRIHREHSESNAFRIHVVSKDTLIRRYDKIKNWPDLLIFDEAHLFLDRQLEIIEHVPASTKIIGFTATPERLDGRGLSVESGGPYETLIEGPSIPWLTENGYLARLRYYAPPLEGLDGLRRSGYEVDEEELEALLERKKIYGELVGHYEKHGRGKPALIFCRSVKSAYQTAERFRDKGFNFHCVEGTMSQKSLDALLAAHRDGEIDGLTTCDLVLYGVDIPRVEYGASIRPTLSRALYMQMIGRLLRPFPGKADAIWMDHVNMVLEHQDPEYPGVPLHYVPKITWNFHGVERRKRAKSGANIRLCQYTFMYCEKSSCAGCHLNTDAVPDARKPMVVVPAELEEIPHKPIPYTERDSAGKSEIDNAEAEAVLDYRTTMSAGAVGKLLAIAADTGREVMWVYHRLTDEGAHAVNWPLLHEIARQKGYKPGWPYMQSQLLKARAGLKNEYRRIMA
jgi:superfamily II DNA or RNA helicase